MTNYCEDCGKKKYDGLCPNCHEEAFIYETQYQEMNLPDPDPNSLFSKKAHEQFLKIRGYSPIEEPTDGT